MQSLSPDKLHDVRLLCDDMLAVQQHANNRSIRATQRAFLLVPAEHQPVAVFIIGPLPGLQCAQLDTRLLLSSRHY